MIYRLNVAANSNASRRAYYNEIDPKAAAWLRELIKGGHIAVGDVDERSIVDIRPADLAGYTQCHFFAGIGVWSYALRKAGWSDDRPVWTGSCPCQPFSAAGKGDGFDDERHLWPHFHWLIDQCRPATVFGEQVASKDGLGWLDLVQADLEGSGYASGAIDTCSAGFGAPHIRQRLWWVGERLADLHVNGRDQGRECQPATGNDGLVGNSAVSGLADSDNARLEGRGQSECGCSAERAVGPSGLVGGLADANGRDTRAEWEQCRGEQRQQPEDGRGGDRTAPARPSPTDSFWRDADWLFCRDGKWRPVEPGTFPLAHGASARVGRLRGYGNAINAEAATGFIEAYLESRADQLAA